MEATGRPGSRASDERLAAVHSLSGARRASCPRRASLSLFDALWLYHARSIERRVACAASRGPRGAGRAESGHIAVGITARRFKHGLPYSEGPRESNIIPLQMGNIVSCTAPAYADDDDDKKAGQKQEQVIADQDFDDEDEMQGV